MANDLTFELRLAADGSAAPDLVHLLSRGSRIAARDGRVFVLDDPEGVVARSKQAVDLPIDYEHQKNRRAARFRRRAGSRN